MSALEALFCAMMRYIVYKFTFTFMPMIFSIGVITTTATKH